MIRRGPASLTAGATAAFIAALAVAAAMLLVLLPLRNNAVIDRLEERSLAQRAQMIAEHLSWADGHWNLRLPPDIAAAFSPVYGRSSFAVVTPEGEFVTGAGINQPLAVPAEEAQSFAVERGGRLLQGIALPVEVNGRKLSIQVAENLRHPDVLLDDAAVSVAQDVAWLVLPVFLILSLVLVVALHRLRRPLRMLAARAEALTPLRAGERLPEEEVPSELLPLVRRLNGLLERAEEAQAEHRAFLADAAHELRTPLAVLRAHLDLLRDEKAAVALNADIWELDRMVAQLLAIAELDQNHVEPPEPVDLTQLAEDIAVLLRPLAEAQGVAVTVSGPAVVMEAQLEAMSQVIANLLENAIGHAPEGSTVAIRVKREGGQAVLEVSDAGPGVPQHERKLIFRRFWRSRRRRDGRRRGVGLGLPIVLRAVELHRGKVEVEQSEQGGALFRVVLPVEGQGPG
ncbi:sensor histidine kinase N-terminal domain-containing protein [Acetobacteraceae bacterium H6797]|nr:sensor histidine kinase N-terminal domain-containing protein [Acetobacteraceae bacterium H6797]